jgi:hypothetical protein
LSEADKWDGVDTVMKMKPASKIIVNSVCGEREFIDSLGAKVEM